MNMNRGSVDREMQQGITLRLKHSLQLLASPAETQLRLLKLVPEGDGLMIARRFNGGETLRPSANKFNPCRTAISIALPMSLLHEKIESRSFRSKCSVREISVVPCGGLVLRSSIPASELAGYHQVVPFGD